jgi:transcriptional regulator EpsA
MDLQKNTVCDLLLVRFQLCSNTCVKNPIPIVMAFLPSLTGEEIHRYHSVVTRSVEVRSHFEILTWLQGDMQRYLPHSILIAAWGNFQKGTINHDIISPLHGVRSQNSNPQFITPLLLALFSRWVEFGKKPMALNTGQGGFRLDDSGLKNAVGDALRRMRCAMVHGIVDERGSDDCVYVTFSSRVAFGDPERSAMAVVLPYIDTALRQVTYLPNQSVGTIELDYGTKLAQQADRDLTEREREVMHWVAGGKTNPEIASILEISAFTVKNHMQRVFKKLEVANRAQAVSKIMPLINNVQS